MEVDLNKDEMVHGWFDIEGGGRVHLKLLSLDDVRSIRESCITTTAEYPYLPIDPDRPELGKEYKRFPVEKLDQEKMIDLINERTIIGWDGLTDKKAQAPIDVTPENKKLLMHPDVCPQFEKAVNEGLKALKKAKTEADEAEKKT